jgi:hypothetical protein
MRYSFKDVRDVIDYNKAKAHKGFFFPLTPKLNGVIGNLQQSQITIVSGMPSSGLSSFVDQNYVISILLQWYNTPEDKRPPLKIFYFSMKTPAIKRIQLLLCNYLKLVYGIHVDLPTLNSQAGKLYNIDDDQVLQDSIDEAELFFDEVFDEEVLTVIGGQKTPTDIYNEVVRYAHLKGDKTSEKAFEYKEEYHNLTTIVVVDATDYLLEDREGHGSVSGADLDDKFQRYLRELKSTYLISPVIIVPSSLGYVRSVKDTEPHFKHLGSYGKIADKGICIYNSVAEKNVKFYDADETLYVTARGNTLMRTWHVVKNEDGIESVYNRLLFLPGTGYMVEHDLSKKVSSIDDVIEVIDSKTPFKK